MDLRRAGWVRAFVVCTPWVVNARRVAEADARRAERVPLTFAAEAGFGISARQHMERGVDCQI